jgi:D-alanyl-D-alanine carboxypeptidase
VHGVERRDVTIPKTKVAHKRAVVNWQGMHIRIPKKALKKSARVKMRNRGALADLSLPTPNKKFRVRGEVYSYHVSGKLQKPLRVRLDFDFDHYGKRRKKILFLPSGGKKWQALPTTMLRRKNKLHAMLPEKSGRVLVVTHKVKRETPKKRSSHSSYRGTPYSDKAVVMDVESGKWLYSQKGKQQQHIASITKLATVYTFLNQDPDLTDVVRYDDNYDRIGATVEVEDGDKFRLTDALYSTLMPSANNMATLLSHNSGFSHAGFVTQMNILADDLNLGKTRFTEQTGLDDGNVSTPKNTARFALHVFQSYPRFFRAAAQSDAYSFDVRNRDERFVVESTNTFEGRGRYEVKGFKTGYYPGTAERTLAIWIQSTESKGEIMIVLFGNPNYGTINDEAYELADWAFRNWRFHNYD